jgi:hypothetical protein
MKKIAFTLTLAALLTVGAGIAGARPAQHAATQVTVVMHDPGCHWFAVGGTFRRVLSVHGPVRLSNLDEASLMIMGPHGMKVARVGKQVTLTRGRYRITMVGQAPDDNHLRLTVR